MREGVTPSMDRAAQLGHRASGGAAEDEPE